MLSVGSGALIARTANESLADFGVSFKIHASHTTLHSEGYFRPTCLVCTRVMLS